MAAQSKINSGQPCVLTINGGSSSIKFALFAQGENLDRIFSGQISGIGSAEGTFTLKALPPAPGFSRPVKVPDAPQAVEILVDWIRDGLGDRPLAAIGHRIVHGGPRYWKTERLTPEVIGDLRRLSPYDPKHLPGEILLIEELEKKFPGLPQFGCFDSAFHHDLPLVAQLLPLPRRFHERGVRRYGFHGLSCTYLMAELERVAGRDAARGRVVLAHLGNGASVTAVRDGRSLDTSMSFTPTAGLPMSTRSGDLDPSLAWYLSCAENVSAEQFHHMINHESGLLGVSETSSDMRVLTSRAPTDSRAAETIEYFCYHARKWICAMASAAGGIDTLIFAGGIGENDASVRDQICQGLGWMGIEMDAGANDQSAPVISRQNAAVTVRVMRTDEEQVIAREVNEALLSRSQTEK
jgi:acetate kinase